MGNSLSGLTIAKVASFPPQSGEVRTESVDFESSEVVF
jgi:hypothetical protein